MGTQSRLGEARSMWPERSSDLAFQGIWRPLFILSIGVFLFCKHPEIFVDRENFYDKGVKLGGGGYFSSVQEMQEPRHDAMLELLGTLHSKKPKKFVKALDLVRQNGWDINKIVFQDSLETWCTLGAHLASRSDILIGRLFSVYLDYPGVDLSGQEALVRMKYFRYNTRGKENNPEAFEAIQKESRVPLVHAFLRQWAQYLPPPPPLSKSASQSQEYDHARISNKHALATELFGKMEGLGVDWTVRDEHGNGLAHVLVERESSKTLNFLLPWMKHLGVSMSAKNNFGLTPSDTAKQRIARSIANGEANSSKSIGAFSQTISTLEHGLLQSSAPQVSARSSIRRI